MLAALSQLPSALTPRTLELSLRSATPGLLVAGVDEAGVGTIAGPLVAAAVALPLDAAATARSSSCRDSKELSPDARRRVRANLRGARRRVRRRGRFGARRLDALGPRPAWALAVRLACRRLERALAASARPHYLVDGDTVPAGLDGTAVPGGDRREARDRRGVGRRRVARRRDGAPRAPPPAVGARRERRPPVARAPRAHRRVRAVGLPPRQLLPLPPPPGRALRVPPGSTRGRSHPGASPPPRAATRPAATPSASATSASARWRRSSGERGGRGEEEAAEVTNFQRRPRGDGPATAAPGRPEDGSRDGQAESRVER